MVLPYFPISKTTTMIQLPNIVKIRLKYSKLKTTVRLFGNFCFAPHRFLKFNTVTVLQKTAATRCQLEVNREMIYIDLHSYIAFFFVVFSLILGAFFLSVAFFSITCCRCGIFSGSLWCFFLQTSIVFFLLKKKKKCVCCVCYGVFFTLHNKSYH